MKKILTALFVLFFCTAGSVWAQTEEDLQPDKSEQIKALYVAYVTKELDLTPTEAEKFWPIHSQYETELKSIKKDLPQLEREQAVLNIKKRFQGNFTGIIGAQRCERFFKARGKFVQKLVDRFKNIRQQRQNGVKRPQRGVRQ